MGKRIKALLLAVMVLVSFVVPAYATSPDPSVRSNSDLTITKTAVAVPGVDGQFKINLTVTGKQTPSKPADIILVIDSSGSMHGDSLAHAKNAARKFAENVFNNLNGSRIAIIDYFNYSRVWYINNHGKADYRSTALNDYSNIDSISDECFSTNFNDVKECINKIGPGGETDIRNAFNTASRVMQKGGKAAGSVNRAIILLSDGIPTEGSFWGDDKAAAINAGKNAQNYANVYTVGLFNSLSNGERIEAIDTLTKAAPAGCFFNAKDDSKLLGIYEHLSSLVNPAATNAVVTDIMSEYFTLDTSSIKVSDSSNSFVVKPGEDTIEWSIGTVGSQKTTTIEYLVNYKNDSGKYGELPTNKLAVINYKNNNNVNNSLEFAVPMVVINTPPVAKDESAAIDLYKGNTATINAVVTDADAGDSIVEKVIVKQPVKGTLVLNSNGTYTYTAKSDATAGTDSFTFKGKDNHGAFSNVATVTITLIKQNRAPEAKDEKATLDLKLAKSVNIKCEVTDPDAGNVITKEIVTDPSKGTLTSNADGSFTYTAKSDATIGIDTFTFKGKDNFGAYSNVASVEITLTESNKAPVAKEESATIDLKKGNTAIIKCEVTDPDAEDSVTREVTKPSNGELTINSDGTYTYTFTGTQLGEDSFKFKGKDNHNVYSNEVTVHITIMNSNKKPVAIDESVGIDLKKGKTVIINAVVTDPDTGDKVTRTIVKGPDKGKLEPNSDGTFTYTYSGTEPAVDSFTFKGTDDGGLVSDPATVSITIANSNKAPVASNESVSFNLNEGKTVIVNAVVIDTDAGDHVTKSIVTDPKNGTLTPNNDGTYTYTYSGKTAGTDSFTFKGTDDFKAESNTATVTITINKPNRAPAAEDESVSINLNDSKTATIVAKVTDPDEGDAITKEIVTQPSKGDLTINSNGTYTYTAKPGATAGNDSFTFKGKDTHNEYSNVATVSIELTKPNRAPEAKNAAIELDLDKGEYSREAAVTVTDPDGDKFTYEIVSNGLKGDAKVESGKINYYVKSFEAATDTFTYKAIDANGAASNVATVTVSIKKKANTAPVGQSVTVEMDLATNKDKIIEIPVKVSDEDGDVITLSVESAPLKGEASPIDGKTFKYEYKGSSFPFTDSFTYVAKDSKQLASATYTVAINIKNSAIKPNSAPVAKDDEYSFTLTSENNVCELEPNPIRNDEDNEGDKLTIAHRTDPKMGSISIINGKMLYTFTGKIPDNAEFVEDTFTYGVSDGKLESVKDAVVTIYTYKYVPAEPTPTEKPADPTPTPTPTPTTAPEDPTPTPTPTPTPAPVDPTPTPTPTQAPADPTPTPIPAYVAPSEPTFNLAVSVTGEGDVMPGPGNHSFTKDTRVILQATPAAGWKFDHWEGDALDNGQMVMSGNKSVTAVFTKEVVVTPEPAPAGPVATPIPEPTTVPAPVKEKDETVVENEKAPAGPTTLPKTGGIPAGLFYGLGGLITAAGLMLKKRQK